LIDLIKKIIDMLGEDLWFTHDKFAHGWLHTMIVRCLRTCGVPWYLAIIYSISFGIIYEVITEVVYPLIRYGEFGDVTDGLKDIVWNFVGCVLGSLV